MQKKITAKLKSPILKPIILCSLISVLLFTKLKTPPTGDILVSFGSAFNADQLTTDFPLNVYQSWNLRGIGYKYLIYSLYHLSSLFVDITDTRNFEIAALALYYIFFFALAGVFLHILNPEFQKLKLSLPAIWTVFFLAIMSSSQFLGLQAEEIAILLTLGMTAFMLSNHRVLNYLSGIFFVLLLMSKLITITYAIFPFLLLIFLGKNYRVRLIHSMISAAIFGIAIIVLYFFVLPLEIKDTIDAIYFQRSFRFTGWPTILAYFKYMFYAMQHMPFLLASIAFTLVGAYLNRKDPSKLLFLFLIWIIAAIPVFLQARWTSSYHYASLILVGFLAILLVARSCERNQFVYFIIVILSSVLLLWFMSIWVITEKLPYRDPYANSNIYKHQVYQPYISMLQEINQRFDLSTEPEILFLDDGRASYIIHSKSYLRYTFPLPLQRAQNNPKVAQTDIYEQTLKAVLNYQGEYIYLDPSWFNLATFPPIQAKINAEYEIVFSSGIYDTYPSGFLFQRK